MPSRDNEPMRMKFGCLHRVSESMCEACFDVAVSGLRAEKATLREDLDLSASRRCSAEARAGALEGALRKFWVCSGGCCASHGEEFYRLTRRPTAGMEPVSGKDGAACPNCGGTGHRNFGNGTVPCGCKETRKPS